MTMVDEYIYRDDLADDVRNFYIQLLDNDEYKECEMEAIKTEFCSEMDDEEDGPVFWIALANVQWNYGRLDEVVKNRAISFIRDGLLVGDGLDSWTYRIGGKEAMEEILSKLISPQPQMKGINKAKKYMCQWKNGDIFAYQMCGKEAKDTGHDMNYVFFVKVDDTEMSNGNIVPIVYMYHIMSDRILDVDELKNIPFIPQFWKPEVYHNNSNRKPLIRLEIDTKSKRSIPHKQLIYIDNIEVSLVDGEDINSRGVYWRFFEQEIIQNFKRWEGHSINEIL